VKYLIVLALFAAVAFIAYWRLRPYIRGARRFLGVLREVRSMREGVPQQSSPKKVTNEKLLRCAACGTWMPASRAVRLRGGASYCSHTCLERAADAPRHERKSAS
jgi:predicted SprT family Zn-dependent metalloprotease